MKTTFIATILLAAAALAGGCDADADAENETTRVASPSESPPSPGPAVAEPPAPAPGGMMAQLRAGCPMMAEGATVAVSDTDNGVALTFTTASGDVGDLRTRAGHMTQMYSMHHGQRGMMWHAHGGGMMGAGPGPGAMGGAGMAHGPGAMGGGMAHGAGMAGPSGMMPAASATVEEVDGGARILLTPTDPADLEALRQHVRAHSERMGSGECPMLNPE